MIKLNPVAAFGRAFPGIRNPSGLPGTFGSLSFDVPVPRQAELLTEKQAVSIIREHVAQPKTQEDLIWLKQSTMFTILEGDSERGRAIACNPVRTALALERYDLFTASDPVELFSEGVNYKNEESGCVVRTPSGIVEFTYDFSLSEDEERFRVLRNIRDVEFLICRGTIPEEWKTVLLQDVNKRPMPNTGLSHPPFLSSGCTGSSRTLSGRSI